MWSSGSHRRHNVRLVPYHPPIYFRRKFVFAAAWLSLLFLVVFVGCGRREEARTLNVAGSTTVLPIVQAAAEEFQKERPGTKIAVQGGGSSTGIEAATTGTADIGTSSRELKGAEKNAGLVDHIIAIDAIAIIVNPSNPVSNLTKAQLKGIFGGRIQNWREVGGADLPIVLVNRDEASGTREAFQKRVLGGESFYKRAVIQPGSGQVRSIVEGTPAAIGYMSLGYVTRQVKVVKYGGVAPTKVSIAKGQYGLQRKLHLFTKGEAKGKVKDFIDFILSPKVQREIVGVEFIPVK